VSWVPSRHRVLHWLWWSRHPTARVARALLLPLGLLYRAVALARAVAYRHGWLRPRPLPLPAVSVGNLSVGGAGKTPIAAWIARFYARRGVRPGVLLRGYGGDESLVHERLVPEAVVVPNADRVAGGEAARAAGARVLVLDDAYQRLDVGRDLNIAVVNTENARAAPWPLPAGPWREGWGALARADLIVVTHRRTTAQEARRIAERLSARWPRTPVAVAHLALAGFEGMLSGRSVPAASLAGCRVVAVAGIADPASFAVQVRSTGASVQLVAYQDHHPYPARDLQRLVRAAQEADYVVVTEKDAVKLRHRWPREAREPLVAVLDVKWQSNGEVVERALAAVSARAAVC
jgi:tetraacyldisaccharide 4'-kinase